MKIFRNKNKEIIKAIDVLNKTVKNEKYYFRSEYINEVRAEINELIKKLDY